MASGPVGSFPLFHEVLVLKVPNNRPLLEIVHVVGPKDFALGRMESELFVEQVRSKLGVDDAASTHQLAEASEPA